jgi:hypothetical protein
VFRNLLAVVSQLPTFKIEKLSKLIVLMVPLAHLTTPVVNSKVEVMVVVLILKQLAVPIINIVVQTVTPVIYNINNVFNNLEQCATALQCVKSNQTNQCKMEVSSSLLQGVRITRFFP